MSDPRHIRTVGLTLLAALLVVASCEVEQPPMAPPTSPAAGEADPLIITVDSDGEVYATEPTTSPEETLQTESADAAPVQEAPVFTPMTVRPEIRNRTEVIAALMREYPAALRDAGIGGTVVVWFFISEEGVVRDTRVSQTSGQAQFDDAALRVAEVLRFTPAMNRTEPVAVWIEVPITFQVL